MGDETGTSGNESCNRDLPHTVVIKANYAEAQLCNGRHLVARAALDDPLVTSPDGQSSRGKEGRKEGKGEGRKEGGRAPPPPSEVLMETKSGEDERQSEDEEIYRKQQTEKDVLLSL